MFYSQRFTMRLANGKWLVSVVVGAVGGLFPWFDYCLVAIVRVLVVVGIGLVVVGRQSSSPASISRQV